MTVTDPTSPTTEQTVLDTHPFVKDTVVWLGKRCTDIQKLDYYKDFQKELKRDLHSIATEGRKMAKAIYEMDWKNDHRTIAKDFAFIVGTIICVAFIFFGGSTSMIFGLCFFTWPLALYAEDKPAVRINTIATAGSALTFVLTMLGVFSGPVGGVTAFLVGYSFGHSSILAGRQFYEEHLELDTAAPAA